MIHLNLNNSIYFLTKSLAENLTYKQKFSLVISSVAFRIFAYVASLTLAAFLAYQVFYYACRKRNEEKVQLEEAPRPLASLRLLEYLGLMAPLSPLARPHPADRKMDPEELKLLPAGIELVQIEQNPVLKSEGYYLLINAPIRLPNQSYLFFIKPESTLADIRTAYSIVTDMGRETFRFIFKGKQMEDSEKKFQEYASSEEQKYYLIYQTNFLGCCSLPPDKQKIPNQFPEQKKYLEDRQWTLG